MILRHVHTLHLHAHAISLKRWKQIFGSSNGIPYTLISILGLQGLHIACYFGVLWTTVSTTGKDNHKWLSYFMFYGVIKTHCANDVIRKLTTIVNYINQITICTTLQQPVYIVLKYLPVNVEGHLLECFVINYTPGKREERIYST